MEVSQIHVILVKISNVPSNNDKTRQHNKVYVLS